VENQTTIVQHTTAAATANKFLFTRIGLPPFSRFCGIRLFFVYRQKRMLKYQRLGGFGYLDTNREQLALAHQIWFR
jgi:hypothetical protein